MLQKRTEFIQFLFNKRNHRFTLPDLRWYCNPSSHCATHFSFSFRSQLLSCNGGLALCTSYRQLVIAMLVSLASYSTPGHGLLTSLMVSHQITQQQNDNFNYKKMLIMLRFKLCCRGQYECICTYHGIKCQRCLKPPKNSRRKINMIVHWLWIRARDGDGPWLAIAANNSHDYRYSF